MRTEQEPKPRVSHSTGQGAEGNFWSGGPQRKEPTRVGERASSQAQGRRTDSQHRRRRVTHSLDGETNAVNSGGVREVGMRALSSHGDPGIPSVLPTAEMRGPAGLGIQQDAQEAGEVDPTATQGRRDEGVEWRHSTEEAS